MDANTKEGGGNFGDVRRIFQDLAHRHDRGWSHPESDRESVEAPDKKNRKTVGIFHFRHDEDEDC